MHYVFRSNPVIGVLWLGFGLVWWIGAWRGKRVAHREGFASEMSHRLLLIPAVVLLLYRIPGVGLWNRIVPGGPLVLAGEIMTALGIAFAFWARFALGGNWSAAVTVKEDHELVRKGPYALARHPIYTGLLFGLLGTAIAVGTAAGFLGVLLATASLKRKSLVEERLMRQQFGDQYTQYERDVRALIPYVW
ncbi:MAG: isoprenylcysteine carboxylmethyltransferase family protein [Cyanobacteria bacterium REEB65]|nr:isoprenylcysteine carboxylmethyltransferase family protein [Cyanobacteria bacterium REEB65]